jgi:thioredoxin-like negative regulator of GroEL
MLIAAVRGRHGASGGTPRVRARELGLDSYPELGVLLQFSAAGSRASRESLNRLARFGAHSDGRVVVVDLAAHRMTGLQARLGARHAPAVYLLAADGTVTHHWARPPEEPELENALCELAERRAVLA